MQRRNGTLLLTDSNIRCSRLRAAWYRIKIAHASHLHSCHSAHDTFLCQKSDRGPTGSSIVVGSLQAQCYLVADRDFWAGAGSGVVHRGPGSGARMVGKQTSKPVFDLRSVQSNSVTVRLHFEVASIERPARHAEPPLQFIDDPLTHRSAGADNSDPSLCRTGSPCYKPDPSYLSTHRNLLQTRSTEV